MAGGHQVIALARDPAKLTDRSGLAVMRGDVMNRADIDPAVRGSDAVIISLGNSQSPFALLMGARRTTPAKVCEVGTRHVVAAMQAAGVRRLIVVSAFGIGDTRPQLPFAFKLFYRTVLREHMADKEKQEPVVKSSGLDWTLVQPVGLTDGPATAKWFADTTGVIRRQQMSRADVAAFLASLLVDSRYSGATVALSG